MPERTALVTGTVAAALRDSCEALQDKALPVMESRFLRHGQALRTRVSSAPKMRSIPTEVECRRELNGLAKM
ncbi:hypothetical protein DDK22_20490 [Cupriavidus necator]|uniref:Uncharacterized protein n=1 Tax=Cupriavidus necator TaxID=106590 RepID=A0A367PHU1_CUPNE|nr:hypothetical protein DDK22_20490 [Cupriavidus necator]